MGALWAAAAPLSGHLPAEPLPQRRSAVQTHDDSTTTTKLDAFLRGAASIEVARSVLAPNALPRVRSLLTRAHVDYGYTTYRLTAQHRGTRRQHSLREHAILADVTSFGGFQFRLGDASALDACWSAATLVVVTVPNDVAPSCRLASASLEQILPSDTSSEPWHQARFELDAGEGPWLREAHGTATPWWLAVRTARTPEGPSGVIASVHHQPVGDLAPSSTRRLFGQAEAWRDLVEFGQGRSDAPTCHRWTVAFESKPRRDLLRQAWIGVERELRSTVADTRMFVPVLDACCVPPHDPQRLSFTVPIRRWVVVATPSGETLSSVPVRPLPVPVPGGSMTEDATVQVREAICFDVRWLAESAEVTHLLLARWPADATSVRPTSFEWVTLDHVDPIVGTGRAGGPRFEVVAAVRAAPE